MGEAGVNEFKPAKYTYYGPSFYFRTETPLLTPSIVAGLQQKQTLLSVGCGAGFLEHFLIEALQVPRENVVLADKRNVTLSTDLKFIRFDASKNWPDFSEKFDYIVFPESIEIALRFFKGLESGPTDQRIVEGLSQILIKALQNLKTPGEVRFSW